MNKTFVFLCVILLLGVSGKLNAYNSNLPLADSTGEGNVYSFSPDTSDQTDSSYTSSQEPDTVEIYVIENFVLPEQHSQFVLSFYTSERTKSKLIVNDENEVVISKEFSDAHKDTINLTSLKLNKKDSYFVIVVEDSLGRKYTSEKYDFEIPDDVNVEGESNFLLLCLFGGTVFILPSPVYVNWNETSYFGLTKEIPLVFLRSGSYTYPMGYFSLEYSFIWKAPVRHFVRIGYKHIFEVPGIEYISPGISGVTNLFGYNGISPEISFGLFKVFNVFTVYTKFRYTFKPGDNKSDIKDISIGLYSGFFAIYF